MTRRDLNASQLAKRAWGPTTDSRGYSVGRNRDRIGHYLAGTSFPEPENIERLAKALDVPIEELASTRPATEPRQPRQSPPPDPSSISKTNLLSTTQLPGSRMRLQVDKVLDWKLVTEIQRMILEAETGETKINPHAGEIVGGIDTEENGTG